MQYILIGLSVFAAIIPMILFLGVVWWLDRYDREPIWMVVLTFFWGSIGGAGLSLFGNTTIHMILASIFGEATAGQITPVVVAPLVEEPTKALILLLVMRSRYFDNATDGFVYGAAAGLGFGMTENFLYFSNVAGLANIDVAHGVATWLSTVGIRTFYSALLHATCSSIIGATLGLTKFRSIFMKLSIVPVGIVIAIVIHGLWNGLLTAEEAGVGDGKLFIGNLILFPLEMLTTFAVFQLSLWSEKRILVSELLDEVKRGTLPAEHVAKICSYLARISGRWAPAGVPQEAYTKAATTLAMRKHQSRHTTGDTQAQLKQDVERLRREVAGILSMVTAAKDAMPETPAGHKESPPQT